MGWESSRIGCRLVCFLQVHADAHQLGWVNGPDAGYQCYEEVYPDDPDRVRKPDASFIRLERLSPDDRPDGHCDIVPDLVAEIISPNDTAYDVREKTEEYLRAGVRLVWVIDPHAKQVDVHRADGSVQKLYEHEELSGEDVVPGFQLRVAELFRVPTAPAKA